MSGYFNARLIDEIISGKPPKRKKEDPRDNYSRTHIGRSFLAVNRNLINGNGEYISKEFKTKNTSRDRGEKKGKKNG